MSIKQKYPCSSSKETKKLAENLAKNILKQGLQKQSLVFALQGELGSGKTTFLQGFGYGLGIKQRILSPTFVLMKRFEINKNGFKDFYHFDCYRINNIEEVLNLGFKEIITNPQNIIAVEWAEKIKQALPKQGIVLSFFIKGENKREIIVENL